MSRGKYLSLEEARKTDQLERFWKEHPSQADRARFNRLLDAMSQGVLEEKKSSPQGIAAKSSATEARQES